MDTRGRTVPAACEALFWLESSLLLECLLALVHGGGRSVHTGQNVQGVVRGLETKVGDREGAREAKDQSSVAGVLTSWRNKKESCLKIA